MKMFINRKKTVSLAYKEKLVADIAYYEKRIEEALDKLKHNSVEDGESSDEESSPYTLNIEPAPYKLRQQEASLSKRASKTLDLALLAIMQSEVNVMVTAPDVRKPVHEDGTWLEVVAECKMDLVSFTITFYAHKPLRRFAPMRYREVAVALTKPAHERELAQSVLPKQNKPHLALQVLQSYAIAFRARRTSLLDLAEKYAEKLKMEAMPEGGYRVKFLDFLTVDWTLENTWSPIGPFCHRMKFAVEYVPNEYLHTIGKLYKQLKDPYLDTTERTRVLSRIFDTCLEAQGPARDLRDSFESDPESAGRSNERRTTIDQEPEVPSINNQHVRKSPKNLPKGKENKVQNSKTCMAPPKTIPKKAKKIAKKSRPNDKEVTSDDCENVSKKSKPNDKDVTHDDQMDVSEKSRTQNQEVTSDYRVDASAKSKPNDNVVTCDDQIDITKKTKSIDKEVANEMDISKKSKTQNKTDTVGNSKSVKRGIENDTNINVKKVKSNNENNGNSKSKTGAKASTKGALTNEGSEGDSNNLLSARSKNNAIKTNGKNASSKNVKHKDLPNNNGGIKSVSSMTSLKYKFTDGNSAKTDTKKRDRNTIPSINSKVKDPKGIVTGTENRTEDEGRGGNVEGSVAVPKKTVNKANVKNHAKNVAIKDTVNTVASSLNSKKAEDDKKAGSSKIVKDKDDNKGSSKGTTQDDHAIASSKIFNPVKSVGSKKVEKEINKINSAKKNNVVDNPTVDIVKKAIHTDSIKTAKPKQTVKALVKKKVVSSNISKNVNTDISTQKEKDKNLNAKEAAPDTTVKVVTKNSEKSIGAQGGVLKDNVDNPKGVGQKTGQNDQVIRAKSTNTKEVYHTVQKSNENKELIAKKNKITNTNECNNLNNDKNKMTVNVGNTKNLPKVKNVQDKNNTKPDPKEKDSNQNVTVEKVVENNRATRRSITNTLSNQQKTAKAANQLHNINTKATILNKFTNVKSGAQTEKRVLQKITDNQTRIAEIMKTKIPMMKSKMKISSLKEKLGGKNVGINKGVETKTKIPLKSLPVFKKVTNNVPTRISPRKLASTFKPSTTGSSNK